MGWEVGGAAEHGLQPRAAAAWEGITSYQGSITGLGAVDSIAQKLGKNQGLFQGAGSRPATPSPTPDTVLSREQVCYGALRECPRLKNTHAYSIAEPGRHPPAQLS